MLNKSRRKIRQGGKSKGKIVAQGELADGWGTWYVREITASQSENEQCSGQGVRRCSQPTFVKVETPFGEPSKDYLAVLLRSGCSNDHLPTGEFDHRFNHRNLTDGERTVAALKLADGKRLTLKPLKRGLKK